MTQNFAENQRRWDRGEVSLDDLRRKGAEHAAYGWTAKGPGFPMSREQLNAYRDGYDDERRRRGERVYREGDRIHHPQRGAGTVRVAREIVAERTDQPEGPFRITGRVGIEWDHHTDIVSPSYYWPQELRPFPTSEDPQ